VDTALVRGVPDSFIDALRGGSGPALDADLARKQHGVYVALLESAGYAIEAVAADERHPDCVFIEDTGVVLRSTAVIARSGAPSRRGETPQVAEALASRFSTTTIEPPGTLDGGDVMQIGGSVYVGRSRRTNRNGIDQLAAICAMLDLPVTIVDVHDALHLKSVVLPLDDEAVLTTPNSVDEQALKDLQILYEAESERRRCSALPMRDGRLMVTANAPATADMLAKAGYSVVPIDVSELQAADGGLTCLSIVFREP